MKRILFIICFAFFSTAVQAQVIQKESDLTVENDTILNDTIELPEIIVRKEKLDIEARKQFQLLQNRVLKVYPYAKITAERLTALNRGMANLKTEKEKKKYFKIVENYLTNEFEAKLKKLSRKQGQILVKLIHRQTGTTTYDLITNLKSGWKAFWSNVTAKLFDINLKTKYDPYQNNEDYLIESILVFAFETGRLQNQPPAIKVDFDNLSTVWQAKVDAATK
jgi:ABC-type transporter MlaC component